MIGITAILATALHYEILPSFQQLTNSEKPTIMVPNPDLVPFFDELYSHHPGLTQSNIRSLA